MNRYIDCRNPEYDKIRVAFWRTRQDGITFYKAAITPCKVVSRYGLTCETFEPNIGYQYTLNAVKRASRNAEASARVELVWFVNRALDLLACNGFETVLNGRDLSNALIDIVKSIECEVH